MLVVLTLAVPFFLRETSPRPLAGPSLEELNYEEISFRNGNLGLGGMVFRPTGDGPFPAVVFIHGSGTSRRDNPWYLTFARELQANGVVVLLPDKRGSERSDGDWRDTSFEVLATDTEAALDYLSMLPDVDRGRVGVIGFSQGGWIAPIVAANRTGIAHVTSVSGAGVTTGEQLWFEEVNNIVEMGTYRFVARLAARFTVPNIRQMPAWRATAGFDPMTYWPRVDARVFVALGAGDTNIPVEESASRFGALSNDVVVRIYPDGGHAISDPVTGRVQQAFLGDLVSFVVAGQID